MNPWIVMAILYTAGLIFGLAWIKLCAVECEVRSRTRIVFGEGSVYVNYGKDNQRKLFSTASFEVPK